MKRKIFAVLLALFLFSTALFAMPSVSFAATDLNTFEQKCGETGLGLGDIYQIVDTLANGTADTGPWAIFDSTQCILLSLINFLLDLGIIVAGIYMMIGGIKYMTAAGNADRIKSAVKTLNASIVGFALLLMTNAAYNFIIGLIQYNQLVSLMK